MIFLIEYDRINGQIVTLREFDESSRQQAEESRLDLELSLKRRKLEHEVVLLEAATKDALRQTHARYFEDLASLSKPRASLSGPRRIAGNK